MNLKSRIFLKVRNNKLTTEGLVAKLPLLNAKGVCLEAGVDYMRFRNWKFGAVKTLSDDELKRIAKVLVEISPNTKSEGKAQRLKPTKQ